MSGGISLGAYKAGVNWFLLEANKRLSDQTYRARVIELARPYVPRPPSVRLGALAGASAGNINAIASAISWCRRLPALGPSGSVQRVDSAEASLLWDLWVPTGFRELEPPHARGIEPTDAALLVRQFFERALLPRLGEALHDTTLERGCRVPVGVTLTSITPDTLRAGPIVAPVQRHSVLAELRVASDSALPAAFHVAPLELRSPTMGSLIFPTPVRDSVIATEAIFSVVKASSAFPVAFAPVEVRYHRYGDLERGSSCPQGRATPCDRPRRGMFSDGGVFDNLPISLTVELTRLNAGDSAAPHLHVIPIDPHSSNEAGTGGPLADARGEPRAGLGALTRLLRNAVPSARAYELQMFTRSLDDVNTASARRALAGEQLGQSGSSGFIVRGVCPDPSGAHVCAREAELRLSGSTRSFPLMGERMSAFGAFFGRPLREYDFYLGVFDGLRQFARASVCRDLPPGQAFSAPDCEKAVVRNALLTDALEDRLGVAVSRIGWTVLRQAARSAGVLGPTEGAVPPDSTFVGDARVVYELSRIRDAGLKDALRRGCPRRHLVDAILCDRDYIGMLRGLDPVVGPGRRNTGGVDPVLVRAVRDPERFADDLYTRMLWRQDRVERWLGTREDRDGEEAEPRTPSSERLVALLEAFYLSGNERYRGGYDPFPSSIPAADKKPLTWVARAAPSYVGAGVLMDIVAFGYRPTWYFRRPSSSYTNAGIRWAATLPALDVVRLDTRRSGGRVRGVAWHLSAGAGLVMLVPKTSLSAIEVVPSYAVGSSGGQAGPLDRVSVDVAARLVGNKLRLSVRRQPQYLWKPPGPRSIRGVIGVIAVNDVPGIGYWTYRLLRAH